MHTHYVKFLYLFVELRNFYKFSNFSLSHHKEKIVFGGKVSKDC